MIVTMKSVGLETLVADLARAGIVVPARATKVIHEVARDIAATAKTFVPVREGTTRDSIGVDGSALAAEVGPTTFYARFLEDGTSKMPPQAFMGPALDRHGHELESGLARVMGL